MYEFKGIDLSTKYIHPSTWEWLAEWSEDPSAPVEAHVFDGGDGMVILTYSNPDGEDCPDDLKNIILTAVEHDWRFIVLDGDGNDCDLFESYEEEWTYG